MISENGKCHQNYRTDYLPEFPHVVALVDTESIDSHSLIVVFALPNIAESTRGERTLSGLGGPIGDDMGGWEPPRSTAQLAGLLNIFTSWSGTARTCTARQY